MCVNCRRNPPPWVNLVLNNKTRPKFFEGEKVLVQQIWATKDSYLVFYLFNQLFDNFDTVIKFFVYYMADTLQKNVNRKNFIVEHLQVVIQDLDVWVETIMDEETLETKIRHTAAAHKVVPRFTLREFREVFEALDRAMCMALDPNDYKCKSRAAFRKFLCLAYFFIDLEFKQFRKISVHESDPGNAIGSSEGTSGAGSSKFPRSLSSFFG